MAKILVVDDEAHYRDLIQQILTKESHTVETAADVRVALETIPVFEPELILSDIRMPGMDGIEFLKKVKAEKPEIDFVLMTAYSSKETAIEALRLGAGDYLEKPFDNTELVQRVGNLAVKKTLENENVRLKDQIQTEWSLGNMVGRSAEMKEVSKLVRQVAPKDTTVLIRGESGTGKELVAKAVHAHSGRKDGPFIAINCGAMPENLLESELFGHEKGAFTGADRQKQGKFEVADGGTLFLDEIGDISLNMQVKLLRALQEKQFCRVGGNQTVTCNTRIVAATNRNLEELIEQGDFRQDFYYRLNIFPVFVAPLRQRKDDVPALMEHFLEKFGFSKDAMEPEAVQLAMSYQWPGNVREMENTIERATIVASEGKITLEDMPAHMRMNLPAAAQNGIEIPDEGINLDMLEKQLILKAIEKAGGNKTKAAKLLGISRRTLYSRLEIFEREEKED